MDDFDDHLAGLERFGNFSADGSFLDPVDEILDDGQRNIRFEQGKTHFTHGRVDIIFGQMAGASEAIKGSL